MSTCSKCGEEGHNRRTCPEPDMSDLWGCPKCGHLTVTLEETAAGYDVATCNYGPCDYTQDLVED